MLNLFSGGDPGKCLQLRAVSGDTVRFPAPYGLTAATIVAGAPPENDSR